MTASNQALITMKDVAEKAGVSMMTVSRVLNKPAKVKDITRDKVQGAMKELGYSPNVSARSLATSRSYFFGLVYMNPSSGYLGQFLVGTLKRCRELGYHLVVESMADKKGKWADEVVDFCIQSKLGGVILPPPLCDDPDVLMPLVELGIPVVRVSPIEHDPRAASVRIDEYHAAYEMTQYLIDCGHKDIGFLKGADNQLSSQVRYQGFCDALMAAGLIVNDAWIGRGDYAFKPAMQAATDLLKDSKNRPTAIFASNDDMAAAVYSAAHRLGLAVPQDLSVTGFDDTPIATTIWPDLTTVRQPIAAMAADAVNLLSHMVENKSTGELAPVEHVLQHDIIKRQSVQQL